jgi:hypothetical protein
VKQTSTKKKKKKKGKKKLSCLHSFGTLHNIGFSFTIPVTERVLRKTTHLVFEVWKSGVVGEFQISEL